MVVGVLAVNAPAAASRTVLVSLGDSYSAGIGVTPFEVGSEPCLRSEHAYAMVAAAELGFDGRSVACGGAVTADLTHRDEHGEAPQIDGIGDADYIAFTMGGNDVGGPVGVLTSTFSSTRSDDFAARVRDLGPLLAAGYAAVRDAAPRATIFVLGYPDSLPRNQAGMTECFRPIGGFLDVIEAHDNVTRLNDAVATAAASAGIIYLDTTDTFAGHEMCTARPYANGIGGQPDSPGASLHPNELGHQVLADLLVAAIARTG